MKRRADEVLVAFSALFWALGLAGVLIDDLASAVVGITVAMGCLLLARLNR